jgi:hypothetical protein
MLAFTGPEEIEVGAVDDQDMLGASHGGAVTEFTALPAASGRSGLNDDDGCKFA